MSNKEPINFERIRTPEQFERLQAFAKTFNHEVTASHALAPLIVVKRGEKWIGFFQIVNSPVVFSAWHNDECEPRDFLESMRALQGWAKMEASLNNTEFGYAAVSIGNQAFSPEIMQKVGMNRMFFELYEVE